MILTFERGRWTDTQLDSLLGATLQKTIILPNGKIQTDHSKSRSSSCSGSGSSSEGNGKGKRIGIGRDVLSNSGVNAVCGFIMAGVGYWYGSL